MLVWLALGTQAMTVTDTIFNRKAHEADFAFGADVGFVSQMESWGTKWLDKNGKQKDILQILKEQGINNVRLRVWVNPSSGWCGKQDVVKMAKRAKAKGMGVMLSFHYSDSWADPGTQDRPAAWQNHTVAQLEQDVYDHTKDIITALQAAGVTPRWAQIGNETKRGMFYPTCQTNKGGTDNFARMLKAGIKACHDCDSSIITIIHLPDGHDNSLYRSMFDALKNRGVKWDMIGMSAYPRWSHLDGPTMITKVMANIKDLEKRYGTKVMVVETGHYWNKAIEGNNYLVGLMDALIKNGDPGCFYWEPESMAGYDLGAWDQNTKRPTEAMDAYLGVKHTETSWIMKVNMQSPSPEQTYEAEWPLHFSADVKHIRNRVASVAWYIDKLQVGTVFQSPFDLTTEDLGVGLHTVWAKATDSDKLTQLSDTVTFFVGQSALLGNGLSTSSDQKGGTTRWAMKFLAPGKYRLLLKYQSTAFCGMDVRLGGDSIARLYLTKAADSYKQLDMEVTEAGLKELQFTATLNSGLPSFDVVRVFPCEGQPVPESADVTAIAAPAAHEAKRVYYSIDGTRLPHPCRGINIVRETVNGQTRCYKKVF